MTISKLSMVTIPSPNYSNTRVNVSKITIHHMAGNLDIWTCGSVFAPTSRGASSNYGIDSEGRIACYVPEEYRSWCSASAWNDNRAITIEVANTTAGCYDGTWAVSDKAWQSLIELCADICSRYGFELEFTGGTDGTLTRHNFYASTNCPGPYIEKHTYELCDAVNALVRGEDMITADDKKSIAQYVWEYWFKGDNAIEDELSIPPSQTISNRYNVLSMAFRQAAQANRKIDALSERIDKIAAGDVDYDLLAKAVADELSRRIKE